MTVFDKYYYWQAASDYSTPPYNQCSPNLGHVLHWLRETYGGATLGCYAARPIRGGSSPSTHAFGAALDWRYSDPQDGTVGTWLTREEATTLVDLLIAFSDELGIQMIMDPNTQGGRGVWKAYRPELNGPGWKENYTSYYGWLHIETHPDKFNIDTPVGERLNEEEEMTEDDFNQIRLIVADELNKNNPDVATSVWNFEVQGAKVKTLLNQTKRIVRRFLGPAGDPPPITRQAAIDENVKNISKALDGVTYAIVETESTSDDPES